MNDSELSRVRGENATAGSLYEMKKRLRHRLGKNRKNNGRQSDVSFHIVCGVPSGVAGSFGPSDHRKSKKTDLMPLASKRSHDGQCVECSAKPA